MMKRVSLLIVWGITMAQMAWAAGLPVGTAFAYQGQLQLPGGPASGLYDFRFDLFDAASGTSRVAAAVTNRAVPVIAGL